MRSLIVLLTASLAQSAIAADCGPTYGADSLAGAPNNQVVAVHYEDARLLFLDSSTSSLREITTGATSSSLATQATRLRNGQYDYTQDKGLNQLAIDAKRGIAWATRFESNELLRFEIGNGNFKTIRLSGHIAGGRGALPLTDNGSLWVLLADPGRRHLENGRVVRISASGEAGKEIPLPKSVFLSPQMAVDRRDRLWLAISVKVGGKPQPKLYLLERGHWRSKEISGTGHFISSLAVDSSNRLWFSTVGGKAGVGRFGHSGSPRLLRFTDNSHPHALRPSPDGSIWFADWNRHLLGRINPKGQLREYPLPTEEESPIALTLDGSGKSIWFSTLFNYGLFRLDPDTGNITRISIAAPTAEKEASSEICDAQPAPIQVSASQGSKPLRHPLGYGQDVRAATFEHNCHTACHTWYRVEQAASRRSDWSATVDRMIVRNGAAFIGDKDRKQILEYLRDRYSRQADSSK